MVDPDRVVVGLLLLIPLRVGDIQELGGRLPVTWQQVTQQLDEGIPSQD